jgi:POT family proton-dependent oligopeptide transporter
MGINIGSFLAPLVCGFLAQSARWKDILRSHGMRPEASWHWGFGAAAVGMGLGLLQYLASGHFLGQVGRAPLPSEPVAFARQKRLLQLVFGLVVAVLCGLTVLQVQGLLHIDLVRLSKLLGYAVLLVPIIYIPLLFLRGKPSQTDRQRMSVIVILFLFMVLFWAAEGQASSSVALFAQRHVRNSFLGYHFPSVWWLSLSSLFVITLSPVMGWLWMRLGRLEPSSPTKFVMGLVLAGLGFLMLSCAALAALSSGDRVSPAWLVALFVLHTLGELCLGPVGLSMVTKLTPVEKGSQMMGVWFLAVSMGSVLGGRFAGLFESLPLPKLFGAVVVVLWGAALVLALLGKPIRRLMGSES